MTWLNENVCMFHLKNPKNHNFKRCACTRKYYFAFGRWHKLMGVRA